MRFTVEDTFYIRGRGIVLIGITADQCHLVKVGDSLTIRLPDGSDLHSTVRGVEYPPSIKWIDKRPADPHYGVLVDVEGVPIGSIVTIQMTSIHIDQRDGALTLPNSISIRSDLSQDAFREDPAGRQARSQDYGTLPFIHYHWAGGEVEGKSLGVSLCFYDQILLEVRLTVDLYPPGSKDWSTYSLEIEAATKQFHDRLLERMLGKPSKGGSLFFRRLPQGPITLERPLRWDFPWGSVSSYHDARGGSTDIAISYGDRMEAANKAYRARPPGTPQAQRQNPPIK